MSEIQPDGTHKFFVPASIYNHIPRGAVIPSEAPPDLTCRACSQAWWSNLKERLARNLEIPAFLQGYTDMCLWEIIWELRCEREKR